MCVPFSVEYMQRRLYNGATMSEFPGKGKVAVLKTSPDTVLDDYERLVKLAEVETALSKDVRTGIKINISWQTWYPACSSAPWQLEGVIRMPVIKTWLAFTTIPWW
jgi:hypothetical protein